MKRINAAESDACLRLDKFIYRHIPEFSRTKIKELISLGNILVNGGYKKAGYKLKVNDIVSVADTKKEPYRLKGYPLSIKIIFEDDDILIISKPENLVVHPPNETNQDTLVNALIYMKKQLSDVDPARPGIVHRLDKETSGVMVIAKNNYAHANLVEQFKKRKIKKEYRALVWGIIKQKYISVNLPLKRDSRNRLKMKVSFVGSKNAQTNLEVIERFSDSSYIKLNLLTGRMHQIRAHLNFLGFPIVGDKKYGRKDEFRGLFLHAYRLALFHPRSNELMEFSQEVPGRFIEFIKKRQNV